MERNKIYQGNVIDVLKEFPDKSINCCVTSPPYWGLRDYGTGEWIGGNKDCNHYRDNKIGDNCITGHASQSHSGVADSIYKTKCKKCGAIREDQQLGLEETPEEYIEKLVDIFREVRRVLSDDGTAWLNLGDTYYNFRGTNDFQRKQTIAKHSGHAMNSPSGKRNYKNANLKGKDLVGIPWTAALALRKDGWYLRSDIIWDKPNPMPESIKDRPTKSHEYIFLLTKSPKYYYDYTAIMEPAAYDGRKDTEFKGSIKYRTSGQTFHDRGHERWPNKDNENRPVKNKRSVWHVSTKPFPEAHFAVYPTTLIEPMIKAGASEKGRCPKCKQQWTRIVEKTVDMRSDWIPGCDCKIEPERSIVLDPFMGSGTTAIVALLNHRDYVGVELNPDYITMADKRIFNETYKKLAREEKVHKWFM